MVEQVIYNFVILNKREENSYWNLMDGEPENFRHIYLTKPAVIYLPIEQINQWLILTKDGYRILK